MKEDMILIRKKEVNHGHKNQFFQDAQKQLDKFGLKFSSCNPFPSGQSAAKVTCEQFQCNFMAILNKNGLLFLVFPQHKYAFWLFKRDAKSLCQSPFKTGGNEIWAGLKARV